MCSQALQHPENVKLDDSVRRVTHFRNKLEAELRNGGDMTPLRKRKRRRRNRWTPTLGVHTVVLFNAAFVALLIYYSW